ncbi:hypothetical protein [Legionella oakridgensis]|nr:hypothetical protein [Legionella oakridgensis]AHE67367.1 hypothetical protein Loa_01820 [Legionella oakridgensis ATCC 33761 = DSM 21215]KTD43437.1 hypothetical protein Loak_0612 [Legionella oakridgensis]STY20428.1 Uncharacterised protein [Legionella longbeachae]
MKISPFQALTLLAKQYRHADAGSREAQVFAQVKHLFLMGVENEKDLHILKNLLKDKALKDHEIALVEPSEFVLLRKKPGELTETEVPLYDAAKAKLELINNDPTRRYFESLLCHDTLRDSIDGLDQTALQHHFAKVFAEMPQSMKIMVPLMIYKGNVNDFVTKISSTAPE